MGLVAETIQSDVIVNGYPVEGTVYYLYCDACGSFRIRTHLKVVHRLALVVLLAIVAAGWNYAINSQSFQRNEPAGCWIVYLSFAVGTIAFLSRYFPYQCLKCGNTNITYQDVLNYSRYADLNSIIDAPKSALHQHTEADRNLMKDLAAIPWVIFALLVMSLVPALILLWLFVGEPLKYLSAKIRKQN